MSRIGKKPVSVPQGVKVELKGQYVKVTGPQGTNEMDVHPCIKVQMDESAKAIVVVNENEESRENKQLHGTMRALISNMVKGVSEGFARRMEIYGTGFSVNEQGGKLVFQVGFCHPVERKIPKGVKVNIEVKATRGNDTPAVFTVSGIDKCELGQFVAELRKIRPPEPYKGKGVRYADEHVRRKVGKAFASGAA
ncbi:MAG: 50S ribosomal protein L6 [Phycisphaerales bacterium]|jgi:large subunit ribosomal protein L6